MRNQLNIDGRLRGPAALKEDRLLPWARHQLQVAADILDNPGGGLLFATQTTGQVKAALQESDEVRYAPVVELLDRAEDHGVRREFERARELIAQAATTLG